MKTKDYPTLTPAQLYNELDRLTEYRRQHGRGRSPDAAQARHYCNTMRAKVKRELKRLGLPTTRPDDTRAYGPGQAAWQLAGGGGKG